MSAKGTTWGRHKYIRIENGRYIYEESDKSGKTKKSRNASLNEIHDFLKQFKVTKGKSGSSKSSKSGGSSKESKGSSVKGSSKEKTSSSEKVSKEPVETSKDEVSKEPAVTNTRSINDAYTAALEKARAKVNKSQLPKYREGQEEIERKKKLKHYCMGNDNKPDLDDLYLEHSRKGTTWKKHKYIGKKNGRYIYPDDKNKHRYLIRRDDGTFVYENIEDEYDENAWNEYNKKKKEEAAASARRRALLRDLHLGFLNNVNDFLHTPISDLAKPSTQAYAAEPSGNLANTDPRYKKEKTIQDKISEANNRNHSNPVGNMYTSDPRFSKAEPKEKKERTQRSRSKNVSSGKKIIERRNKIRYLRDIDTGEEYFRKDYDERLGTGPVGVKRKKKSN